MHNFFLLTIFFSFWQNMIFAQASLQSKFNYKATYVLSCKPNSFDTSYKVKLEYDLFLNDSISYFAETNTIKYDSIFFTMNQSARSVQELTPDLLTRVVNIPKAFFKSTVIKKQKTNNLIYTEPIERTIYGYQEPLSSIQWKLKDTVYEYMGMMVKQAVGLYAGRKYTATYTEAIPFSDGPYKFTGLPGLIVQIEDKAGDYKYALTSFTKNTYLVASLPIHQVNVIDKNKFLSIRKNYYTNPRPYLEQSAKMRNTSISDDFIEMGVENILKWGRAMSNNIER